MQNSGFIVIGFRCPSNMCASVVKNNLYMLVGRLWVRNLKPARECGAAGSAGMWISTLLKPPPPRSSSLQAARDHAMKVEKCQRSPQSLFDIFCAVQVERDKTEKTVRPWLRVVFLWLAYACGCVCVCVCARACRAKKARDDVGRQKVAVELKRKGGGAAAVGAGMCKLLLQPRFYSPRFLALSGWGASIFFFAAWKKEASQRRWTLVAPNRAILEHYRCDTPFQAIPSQGGFAFSKWCDIFPWYLSFAQAHLCDTPLCNTSCDNHAIHDKTSTNRLDDTIATCMLLGLQDEDLTFKTLDAMLLCYAQSTSYAGAPCCAPEGLEPDVDSWCQPKSRRYRK